MCDVCVCVCVSVWMCVRACVRVCMYVGACLSVVRAFLSFESICVTINTYHVLDLCSKFICPLPDTSLKICLDPQGNVLILRPETVFMLTTSIDTALLCQSYVDTAFYDTYLTVLTTFKGKTTQVLLIIVYKDV